VGLGKWFKQEFVPAISPVANVAVQVGTAGTVGFEDGGFSSGITTDKTADLGAKTIQKAGEFVQANAGTIQTAAAAYLDPASALAMLSKKGETVPSASPTPQYVSGPAQTTENKMPLYLAIGGVLIMVLFFFIKGKK